MDDLDRLNQREALNGPWSKPAGERHDGKQYGRQQKFARDCFHG